MPIQRINKGTQAMEGTARKACSVGSIRWRMNGEAPAMAPINVPAKAPSANPAPTRASVATQCNCNSPLLANSCSVLKITDGGGIKRPETRPDPIAHSHTQANNTGTTKPIQISWFLEIDTTDPAAGSAACCCLFCSAASTITHNHKGKRAYKARFTTFQFILPALFGRKIGRVNQAFDNRLDINIGFDHTGVLQSKTRTDNGVRLCRADRAMGQLGALQLLGNDGF